MSYVFKNLPPFAADYSGVASALHDLGGLVVIHDASGCTGSFTGYDEPRWFNGRASVYCSGLREFDAILGNDQRLLDNIADAAHDQDFAFVAIVGSPVPMLVGFDFDGFAHLVENETGIPAFGFATTGLECYHKGFAAACIALADRFCARTPVKRPGTANILGASPLDNFDAATVERLKAFLAGLDLSVISVWGQGDQLAAMREASSAALNLVVSAAALPLARHMEKRWGIPFVQGIPLGKPTGRALEAKISCQLGSSCPMDFTPSSGQTCESGGRRAANRSILLLGEQTLMNALRHELRHGHPESSIAVASFFAWDPSSAETGDSVLRNEAHALELLETARFDLVLGDPLFRSLLSVAPDTQFLDEPHYAVSGRLYRDHTLETHFAASADSLSERIGSLLSSKKVSESIRVPVL